MQTRVITLRFNELIDGFDDAPLRDGASGFSVG